MAQGAQFQLRRSTGAWLLRNGAGLGAQVLADSRNVTELTQGDGRVRLLFPAEDVRLELLLPCPAPTDLPADLPQIGEIEFLSLCAGGPALAWRCPRPRLPFAALQGQVCFNTALITAEQVD